MAVEAKRDEVARAEGPPGAVGAPGLVSILVPCCGQLEHTKLCVPALLRHTRPPYELVFIDVGSLDGTAEYLAGLAAGLSGVRVEVVRAATDPDVPRAVGRALELARGELLVLLNDDVVVTDSWLGQMAALAELSPAIGLVGPTSNYAAPPQLAEGADYRVRPRGQPPASGEALDVSAIDGFARVWRERHRGKWVEAERLGGFCLLVKRAVLLKLGQAGGPAEAAGLGLFDTDALSAGARAAGYTLACCRDLFVHHFGTRVFAHAAPAEA